MLLVSILFVMQKTERERLLVGIYKSLETLETNARMYTEEERRLDLITETEIAFLKEYLSICLLSQHDKFKSKTTK